MSVQPSQGWKNFQDALSLYLEQMGYECTYLVRFHKQGAEERSFFVLPLCDIEWLQSARKEAKDYRSPVFFLIADKRENPYLDNDALSDENKKEFFGNPRFGNISKAILSAEIITTTTSKDSSANRSFKNVVNILDEAFPENVINFLKNPENISNDYGRYREKFYSTFVDYYYVDDVNLRNIGTGKAGGGVNFKAILDKMLEGEKKETELYKKLSKLNEHDVDSLITCADIIYCYLNDINYNDFTHRVDHELFRAPIPFPLQELIDAKKEIESRLQDDKKTIKLLLIDNKLDKVKHEGLINVLFGDEVGFSFELIMLEGWVYDGLKRMQIPKEKQKFEFKKFKESSDNIYTTDDFDKKENYAWKVYEKIKESHFVLLDFFLNKENTYLAFDFIKDMAEIKKHESDSSTTWYFITSAVYDSVVKYSQSGLLAEYYESAVVSAGDDPTNKKRQIIFIYKLLTFINARIKSFSRYKDLIFERMLGEWRGDKEKPECCVKVKKNGSGEKREDPGCQDECGKDRCLERMQTAIKRYLTEYDNIYSLFYDKKDEYKTIVELLDDTITKFLLLPEADWQIIQHQIDYINAMLRKTEGKRQFSCSYINKEIERRSEIY